MSLQFLDHLLQLFVFLHQEKAVFGLRRVLFQALDQLLQVLVFVLQNVVLLLQELYFVVRLFQLRLQLVSVELRGFFLGHSSVPRSVL